MESVPLIGAATVLLLSIFGFCFLNARKAKRTLLVPSKADPKDEPKYLVRLPHYPLIGNLLLFKDVENMIENFQNLMLKYGPFTEASLPGRGRLYITCDIKTVKEISSARPRHFRRPRSFILPAKVIGVDNGLFFAEGHEWSRIRRFTAPSFNKAAVVAHVENVWQMSQEWTESLVSRSKKDTEPINFLRESIRYTLSVITKVAFDDLTDPYLTTGDFTDTIFQSFEFLITCVTLPIPEYLWCFTRHGVLKKKVEKFVDNLTTACKNILHRRLNEPASSSSSSREAMIDVLLRRAKEDSSDNRTQQQIEEDILDQIKTVFVAGSETTSVTISSAVFVFTQYPEVLKRVREEASLFLEVYGEGRKKVTLESIQSELVYTCAMVKETIRLFSPGNMISYELVDKSETYTTSSGITMSGNDAVFIIIDAILRNPEAYPEPLEFRPERWIPRSDRFPEGSTPEQMALAEEYFYAFGAGSRVCPGMALAYLEAQLAVAMLACKLTPSLACPVSDVKRVTNFTAQLNQLPVIFTAVDA